MKRIGAKLSVLVLAGSLASSVFAAEEGIILKEKLSDTEDYCHIQFPAMKEGTLTSDHPQLKDASNGDMIDYYGSCDETPTSANQIMKQKMQEETLSPVFDE